MNFRLEINCDNAAFMPADPSTQDADAQHEACAAQVALILADVAKHVANGNTRRNLIDTNGNSCGSFEFVKDATYRIVRFYKDPDKESEVVEEGLSFDAAKRHCENPATSGSDWFDGFQKED